MSPRQACGRVLTATAIVSLPNRGLTRTCQHPPPTPAAVAVEFQRAADRRTRAVRANAQSLTLYAL